VLISGWSEPKPSSDEMETPVDVLYNEYRSLSAYLKEKGEVSFHLSIEVQYKKSLVMAAASYFEGEVLRKIEEYYSEKSNGDDTALAFVRNKAIKRQYHSYFSWDKTNGYTQFFGLLGQEFQSFMKAEAKRDTSLTPALEAFISIGNERNLLAHLNYASYDVTKTIDEIYALYETALYFVTHLSDFLRKHSVTPSS
jgi:hypothetical protein